MKNTIEDICSRYSLCYPLVRDGQVTQLQYPICRNRNGSHTKKTSISGEVRQQPVCCAQVCWTAATKTVL